MTFEADFPPVADHEKIVNLPGLAPSKPDKWLKRSHAQRETKIPGG
jgi:hypothetical protein